jgi:DNA polymerase beta
MNNNQIIIQKLTELLYHYKNDSKLKFKYIAINKALSYIKAYEYPIKSGKYAKEHIANIGDGIANRIDEIIKTGTLKELPNEYNEDIINATNNLLKITGLGETKIKKLINMGITNVDHYIKAVEEGKIKSTHHIDIGIKYYDDFQKRIPRQEIEKMEIILKKELNILNSSLIFNICGSYRRGKNTCGDIDILITNKDENDKIQYLPLYIKKLTKIGFLIDNLTVNGQKKYMGVCKIDKFARRIDIRFVNYSAYYAALIYFTGSKNFNIYIRNKAIEKKYSLNEYGLKDKNTNNLICLHTEKEIFDLLGIDYCEPTERDI